MISKKDILDAVRAIKRSDEGWAEKRMFHPGREWGIGIMLFVMVVSAGALYNYSLYQKYNNIQAGVGDGSDRVPTYRSEIVSDVVSVYQTRQAAYDAARALPQSIPATATAASEDLSTTTPDQSEDATAESVETDADSPATTAPSLAP